MRSQIKYNPYAEERCILPLFIRAKIWGQPKYLSQEEWMKTVWHRDSTKYYSVLENKKILTSGMVWMNSEDNMLNRNMPSTDRQMLYDLTCKQNLTKWKWSKTEVSGDGIETEQMLAKGRKISFIGGISSGNWFCNIMTIVSNVLSTWKLLWKWIWNVVTTKNEKYVR